MDPARDEKPTFLWRGILILLPVVLLTALGLYSLRHDRQMAEVEAQSRCREHAERLARDIALHVPGFLPVDSLLQIDPEGNAVSIGGSTNRARFSDVPSPQYLPETALSSVQAHAWNQAKTAESAALWRGFINLSPPPAFLTEARYNLALALAANHENVEAIQLFREVMSDHKTTTDSGCPLWLLAGMRRAELSPPKSFDSIYRDLVDHPTFETPAILAQVMKLDLAAATIGQEWMNRWNADEQTRDFYLHVRSALPASVFWTTWEGGAWLAVSGTPPGYAGVWLLRYDLESLRRFLSNILKDSTPPSYTKVEIEIENRNVLAAGLAAELPVLATASGQISLGTPVRFAVREFLARPEILFAEQRKRTRWFAGFILAAAAVALAGFVSAYRGFHQQLRLSEMKSNFVSSVSHELRAPIASMRLLAESLERGKVPDPVKQKEYYGFLVQESRRLSSLIENILDFSRIEQGRKSYQFELTNLETLVEQTVRLMEPSASDHGVKLSVQKTESTPVSCDGLALQQALINLIDNAVKHSPNGAEIRIGLESDSREARLWVEDSGPGIPAEEHGRIFERFYRRGSELRRETQGIGIGLSIVKHTVEAHGGRIEVRSAAGQGSRFTMVLPQRS